MRHDRNTADDVLRTIIKDLFTTHTITSIATTLQKTRQGIWKIVKKMEEEGLLLLESVSTAKTGTVILKINWEYPTTEKTISLLLTKESLKPRWITHLSELRDTIEFIIVFGKNDQNLEESNNIHVLSVLKNKTPKIIEEITGKIQKIQSKKNNITYTTKEEFDEELKKSNEQYKNAIKNSIIIHGQDAFTQYIRGWKK